jgi:hypothetical protein
MGPLASKRPLPPGNNTAQQGAVELTLGTTAIVVRIPAGSLAAVNLL